jgi:hypothetical protein
MRNSTAQAGIMTGLKGAARGMALCGLAWMVMAQPAAAQTSGLKPALAPIGFLVGHWTSGEGKVAETGGTARGASTITAEAGGAVLLRRDHTDLFDAGGKPSGGFDQIMMIYAEAGGLRADYSDGEHLIHYVSAEVVPGRSVTFTSAAQPGAPVFRLSYSVKAPDTLAVMFGMIAPGQSAYRPIAAGELHRGGS